MFQDFLQDLRFGFRMLRRNPGFSSLAILCLTLGIGANAAVFSWIEGVALRPFPGVAHQERLVVVAGTRPAGDKGAIGSGYTDVSLPDFKDFARDCNLIESFIVDRIMATTLNIGERADRVAGTIVSSNYFAALGVHPYLGRAFMPEEDSGRNAHPVVIISYWLWKERFHSDPAILGKTQMLNGLPHTIVGVAPEGFYGTFVGYPMQLWVPMSMQELFNPGGYKLEDRAATWIEGFATLKPGVSIDQAQEQISAVAKRLEADYLPTNRGHGIKLLPLWKDPFNQAGELLPTLEITFAVVFLVLLIACANVSSLLLVRAFARRQEMTIRFALGSKRGRLLRQVFTEGLILSSLSAIGGLIVAYLSRNLLVLFFPGQGTITVSLRGEMDWRVLALSASICLVSTMLFAIIPALQTGKIDLASALKSEAGSVFGGHGKSRIRSALVLVQVSLSFILLVGAALLIQSLQHTRTADPGFSADNVLTTIVDLTATGYDTPRAKVFYDNLVDRVQALPGVESVAMARIRPFSYAPYLSAPIAVDNYQPALNEQPTAESNQVGPEYFATMGIPLMSGREFTRSDNETAPLVAIVNQKMVDQYWNGQDPVGKRLIVKGQPMLVIGVARNSRYQTFSEAPKPFFYVPLRQNFSARSTLNIRTARDPESISAALYREMQALDNNLAPAEVISLREHINRSALSSQNIAVALLSIFGGLALVLAAVGLYGIMSYAVSQNTRELGLRMAFGARTSDLLRLVMAHGLGLTIGGVMVGSVVALLLTRQIADLLYKVNPRDPLAFGLAMVVMTFISMLACFLPAWRATRTDPVRALRD